MPKFYFTYGTDGQPFVGGWTEVEAPTVKAVVIACRAFHPDKTPGLLNCSDVYPQEQFERSEMFREGNQFYGGDGIVTKGVENTIRNIGRLAHDGMAQTDKEIIDIMLHTRDN